MGYTDAFGCDVCQFAWITLAWGPIFTEVAVLAFFHEHELDPKALFDVSFYPTANRKIFDAIKRVDGRPKEPPELAVTVEIDGNRLTVTPNDEARVTDVTDEG